MGRAFEFRKARKFKRWGNMGDPVISNLNSQTIFHLEVLQFRTGQYTSRSIFLRIIS